MKLVVITHVSHIKKGDKYYGYAPYIREMNIWSKNVDEILLVAPIINEELDPIYEPYQSKKITFFKVPSFQLTSISALLKTIWNLPFIFYTTCRAMSQADHIHLRCPGNMGLIGAIAQLFFPKKSKSAKYAGNWDPKSKQPWSYRLQKWLIANPYLSKNMQVMVYGGWPKTSKNVKTFFTATYSENQKEPVIERALEGTIHFLFVGTLVHGKQPLYALNLFKNCLDLYPNCDFTFYGEGILKEKIEEYIANNQLKNKVFVLGNQSKETVRTAYQKAHFLLLPSKSEGWPKVVAEAMFWGCVPVVTPVSCVPYMLDFGTRGILLTENLERDVQQVTALLADEKEYQIKSSEAMLWSRQFTTEAFEQAIQKLIQPTL